MLFPSLQIMISGLLSAFRAMWYGLLLIMACLTIWSILAVQIIHPLNKQLAEIGIHADCERCPRAFESVWQSCLTLTQTLIAVDSWGPIAIPIIEHYPLTYVFFIFALMTISVSVMNLILAVILDAAAQARVQCDHDIALVKEEEKEKARSTLLQLCEILDDDDSGFLTLPELLKGYKENADFRDSLNAMDIQEGDIETVFHILDEDRSGEVSFEEFAGQMQQIRSNDSHTMLVFIRHHTKCIYEQLVDKMDDWVDKVSAKTTMSVEHELQHHQEATGALRFAASPMQEVVPPHILPPAHDAEAARSPTGSEDEDGQGQGQAPARARVPEERGGDRSEATVAHKSRKARPAPPALPEGPAAAEASRSSNGNGAANFGNARIEAALEALQKKMDALLSATVGNASWPLSGGADGNANTLDDTKTLWRSSQPSVEEHKLEDGSCPRSQQIPSPVTAWTSNPRHSLQ
jgi:hypothetical protein